MKYSRDSGRERGMTLVELMIALIVFGIIVGGVFGVLRSQSEGFRLGTQRMDALQNLRFAAELLSLDLRTAGSNVPDEQPFLVYAGADVVAFNADYVTNVANDAWAVYYDPDAPGGSVTALTQAQPITIPHSTVLYPDTSYRGLGGTGNSPAETIVFFFDPDSSTTRPDDYGLFKKVNRDRPELVARNLLQTPGVPFFEYLREVNLPGGPRQIVQIAAAGLPLAHSAPIHGSAADAGVAAIIDSVRAVRVNFTATNGLTGPAERRRSITRLVRMPNAGLAVRRACGDAPLLGTNLVAAGVMLPGGTPAVNLAWGQAIDESGGEQDVTRYVIWRRGAGQPSWGDPYLSVPAGQPTYSYQDLAVASGDQYTYALAVQDCTPTLSPMSQSALITVP